MKKKLSFILIIVALIVVMIFIYVKVNHPQSALSSNNIQVNEASLSEVSGGTIYLYHGENVLKIDGQDPLFRRIVDMAGQLVNPALDAGDLVDGSLIFTGGGEQMESNSDKYYLEIDLNETQDVESKVSTYKGISKIVFDTSQYCFYLYDSEENEEAESIAGFGYMDNEAKDEFNILMGEQFSINIQKYFEMNQLDGWDVEFQNNGTYAFLSYEGEEEGTFEVNEVENITIGSLLDWVGGMHGYQDGEEEITEKDGYEIMKIVVSFEQSAAESENDETNVTDEVAEAAKETQIHYFYTKSDSHIVGDLCFEKDAASDEMMEEIANNIIMK